MKYLKTICGNYSFDFNGNIIIAWVVVGNTKLCISLDNYEGQWLELYGKFAGLDAEKMQKYLISIETKITNWLPVSLQYAEDKRKEKAAELQAKQDKEAARVKKDRGLKIYRSVTLTKGQHKINIVTQPYEVGIYIAISDSKLLNLIQTGANNHRGANRLIDRIIENHKGYKLTGAKLPVSYPLN